MYYNKKRTKSLALLGLLLMLGVCGCNAETPVREEEKLESIAGDVTEAVEKEPAEMTKAVTQEPVEITQAVTEKEEETIREAEPKDAVEVQPGDAEDAEKAEVSDVLKEMEPEELVLHVLTNAEGVHFNSGGAWVTELLGYAEEKDIAYFVIKIQKNPEALLEPRGGETIYIGVLNPETGELIHLDGRGGETADGNMVVKETGTYIIYAAGWTAQGLIGGEAGVYRTEAGELVPVWPVTADGEYDEDYWNMHTVSLNGEALEIYKVIIMEVRPDGIANEMITELERTLTLDEILAGAV